MTSLERFRAYLSEIELRLKWRSQARGAALFAFALLAATVALSLVADHFAFSGTAAFWSRLVLFLAAGCAAAFGLGIPALLPRRGQAARLLERTAAGLEQRALTLDQAPDSNPFAELLAQEALARAASMPPRSLVSSRILGGLAGSALAGVAVLIWLTLAGPGSLGYGAHLLWAGAPRTGEGPLYQLAVKPGDAKVRRGGDLAVEALLSGFETPLVSLRARRAGSAQWETLRMEPRPGGRGFAFLFSGLASDVEYQVEAGRLRSPAYRLSVVDLPGVKSIRATYHYPAWLGLRPVAQEQGGDLRAVEGSEADVLIETTQPLPAGVLVLDDGARIALSSVRGNLLQARVPIRRDGAYYVAAIDDGTPLRLSQDYFIEAQPEKPPRIRISRPGRDTRVSPIEEVTVEVEASDDFGLHQVELKYSVNGGPEQTVPVLKQPGAKDARGGTLIALEEFKLAPGDVVAMHAAAAGARATSRTDMMFLEAQPFEKEFQQSQSAGGGGGEMGERQNEISRRQKEIIAATFNHVRAPKPKAQASEEAAFLGGMQQKLSEQAKSLAQRMRSRDLTGTNEEFQRFAREMDEASRDMLEAAAPIKARQWKDALPPEQRALQHLLRAESIFRQIQVAFEQQQGGGGGGGGQMRDLESLFDLELDTGKNQYETAQNAGGGQQKEKEVDEALKKLEELARRQQDLAQQQQKGKQQQFEQRWAQEMLRREAEDLRRRMEQMESGAQQSQGSSSQQRDQRMGRAGQQLERALEDMRRAQSQSTQGASENARRAAERIEEAGRDLRGMRRQQSGERLDEIARRAAELADKQKRFEQQLNQAYPPNSQPRAAGAQAEAMAKEKEAMQRDWQTLEQRMRETARSLESSRKGAASKLREALGEAQQNELGVRLKLGAEWMRRGLAPYIGSREKAVTQILDQLNRQANQAREMAGQGDPGQQQAREQAERGLSRIERLREQLQGGGGDAVRQLRQFRDGAGEETRAGVDRILRQIEGIDPKLLEGRIQSQVLPQLEQIELKLRRQLEDSSGGQVRSGAQPQAPAGYGEAVAEYFRRLSQGK
ncbi:MAG: hypothetical protein HY858_01805 [Candidatus Solibacter usitatus]|nr:hypothetical protein [Candidatus Solibacter usitatus]